MKFALSEGQLGLLLISMSSGVLCGLTFSVRAVEYWGARLSAYVTVFGASLLFALIPWMPTALTAAPLFFVAGLFTGAFEINANIEADRHEALLGYRIMSRAHGMWSLGFFVTALVAAGLRQAGVSIEVHMAAVVFVVLASGTFVFASIVDAPRRHTEVGEHAPAFASPTIGLLPLCLIGAAPLLAEGAGVDWSAIYMRDVFAVEPFVGGLSVTLFSLAIAIGRLLLDPAVDRFGPRAMATWLLAIAGLGLVLVASLRRFRRRF